MKSTTFPPTGAGGFGREAMQDDGVKEITGFLVGLFITGFVCLVLGLVFLSWLWLVTGITCWLFVVGMFHAIAVGK